jgi:hypothetical protein
LRVLGANCGSGFVHFAIIDQRRFVDAEPRRYSLSGVAVRIMGTMFFSQV